MERLYSITDAGQRLGGVSRYTIEAWLSAGKLKRTKVGRRTMVSEAELQRFVDECTMRESTDDHTPQ
jgi:excisionase family DNA binding protein